MPQWAIVQSGSRESTSRKAFSPSLNQNECSSATARANAGCTSAEQLLAKTTLPSCSGELPLALVSSWP